MSRRPRIVALADSLAMPRDEAGEVLLWEETWPSVLESLLSGSEVINCGARARATDWLRSDLQEHVFYKKPDVVVLQVGIVDCSPRIFTKLEKRILGLPVVPETLRRRVIARRSARRSEITGRDPLARVQTAPDDFARHVDTFAARVAPVRLVVLPILSHPTRMEAKSPGHGGNVSLYNDLLRDAAGVRGARFVERAELFTESQLEDAFLADAYHLSAGGSRTLAHRLAPIVTAVLQR